MYKELSEKQIQDAYQLAKEEYASLGIDTEKAMQILEKVPFSIHCWQGDDVKGFENCGGSGSDGILSTGNYPGPAANPEMLRKDIEKALSLIPGAKKVNLHACYAELEGQKVSRDQYDVKHFQNWIDWAKKQGVALDFNPTFFGHPLAANGSLSNPDPEIRKFWIRHGIACRKIAEAMGKQIGKTCFTNFWMPDGAKDQPADRVAPRERMMESLDEIFAVPIDQNCNRDALECKLFGIGVEDYTVVSHEFMMEYTSTRKNIMPTLDMGHFHPTETIHDKISAILLFQKELLLHVSRGIRWDSDHVVNFTDDIRSLFQQIVRGNFLDRIHIATDYFDGSINRIGAWAVGVRATQKGLLAALLEPAANLRQYENGNDNALKLALLEEAKTAPLGAIWNEYCRRQQVPVSLGLLNQIEDYDRQVIRKR